MSLLELFCDADDFCQQFDIWAKRQQLPVGKRRGSTPALSASEVMTILVHFHQAGYRDFRSYYQKHVSVYLRDAFPGLVSYSRFVEMMPSVLLPLCAYLQSRFGSCSGISFVDSTPIVYATTDVSPDTRCLKAWQHGAKLRWVGFTASNCISL